MTPVLIEPGCRDLLTENGLASPADFLRLQGVIVCGHPDRNVAEVVLDAGSRQVRAFLKREHRVRWRDRLASAWAGCGFVSKSLREFAVLRVLRKLGVGCPEPLAAGEDERGKAFLLLREVPGARDLRTVLRDQFRTPRQRRLLARRLGAALARLHATGFNHPDLYANHVLVSVAAPGAEPAFHFLDWQRSRWQPRLSDRRRWRDLAALDATLPDELGGPRERLECLRSYLDELARRASEGRPRWRVGLTGRSDLKAAALGIRRVSGKLLRRRHVRDLRQAPLRPRTQNLIWLDGEALCVTRAFGEQIADNVPADLRLPARPEVRGHRVEYLEITLPNARQGALVRRSLSRPLRWLWTCLRRKALPSPELEQAGTIFRLQRYGVPTPRLLAVGQRHSRPWRTESFLLTEPPPAATHLVAWLTENPRHLHAAGRRQRLQLIRQAAQVLRRTHEAGYALAPAGRSALDGLLLVQATPSGLKVVLGDPEGLARHAGRGRAAGDLRQMLSTYGPLCTRAEALRFLLAYLGTPRLTPEARALVRAVMGRLRRMAA